MAEHCQRIFAALVTGDYQILTSSRLWLTNPIESGGGGFNNIQASPAKYWSSSVLAPNTTSSWAISFADGSTGGNNPQSSTFLVWPVRGTTAGGAQVPQTGQTPTTPVTASAGFDGYTYTGISWAYKNGGPTSPATRFESLNLSSGSCITDNLTGLSWVQNLNTIPDNASNGAPWASAIADAAYLNVTAYCGFTDWRLPNINELSSLANYGYNDSTGQPAANWLNMPIPGGAGFSNVRTDGNSNGNYWSSSVYAPNILKSWVANFHAGNTSSANQAANAYIWPVRGG